MIKIKNLRMTYRSSGAEHVALNGVSLTVNEGEFYTLLGPSGCGKTTTLRCVAGLEKPDSGEITIDDQVVFSSSRGIWVPPYARKIGMVFQSYAIWPHMSVFENVAFPLKHLFPKPSRVEIRERVHQALALVHLDGLADRPAPFLSGGQQQRLALARALVAKPRVILLDEPLSNLDAKLREDMRSEIRKLIEELRLTTLFVTHEQIEALTMSDTIGVMNEGIIAQQGSPAQIYGEPGTIFVADFIGKTNFLKAKVISESESDAVAQLESQICSLSCRLGPGISPGDAVTIAIRPENVVLNSGYPAAAEENTVAGEVQSVQFLGNMLDCTVKVGSHLISVQLHPSGAPKPGSAVSLHFPVDHCLVIRG